MFCRWSGGRASQIRPRHWPGPDLSGSWWSGLGLTDGCAAPPKPGLEGGRHAADDSHAGAGLLLLGSGLLGCGCSAWSSGAGPAEAGPAVTIAARPGRRWWRHRGWLCGWLSRRGIPGGELPRPGLAPPPALDPPPTPRDRAPPLPDPDYGGPR